MECITQTGKRGIAKNDLYDKFYSERFLDKFLIYHAFIGKYNIEETNFEESELLAFSKIEVDRSHIITSYMSLKEISAYYFDDSKYISKKTRLHETILKILGVTELPIDKHDQQFVFVLHCKNKFPKAIILCENFNQLRKPRKDDIEFWFAGGRNTAKLKFVVEPTIPFYYLGDWDNRGIEIYQDIKKNIFPKIQILIPSEPIKLSDVVSEWKTEIDYTLFPEKTIPILKRLIPDKWIEEENIRHDLLD